MPKTNTVSLSSRLKVAKDEKEIVALLQEAESFTYASDKTRRRWKRIANVRRSFLSNPTPVKPVAKIEATPAKNKYRHAPKKGKS